MTELEPFYDLITPDRPDEIEYGSIMEEMIHEHPDLSPEYFQLNERQWKFAVHYPETFDTAKAAEAAGYKAKDHSGLRFVGAKLLHNPYVRFWIQEFISQRSLAADAILARLADIAMGSLEDFITVLDGGMVFFDLKKAEERGKLHLIKKLRYIKSGVGKGGIEIELHDPIRAMELLGKNLQMWDDTAIRINDYKITIVREEP